MTLSKYEAFNRGYEFASTDETHECDRAVSWINLEKAVLAKQYENEIISNKMIHILRNMCFLFVFGRACALRWYAQAQIYYYYRQFVCLIYILIFCRYEFHLGCAWVRIFIHFHFCDRFFFVCCFLSFVYVSLSPSSFWSE